MLFSDPNIAIATTEDLPRILQILNAAYRGKISEKGWTSETQLIDGDVRTTLAILEDLYSVPGSVFLKFTKEDEMITGCVNLQKRPEGMYLGMLAVYPTLQNSGTGKKLLYAAEEYAAFQKADTLFMTVISLRHTLIDWYKRYGYTDTGSREPFEEDGIHGKHLLPLEFAVLEKKIQF